VPDKSDKTEAPTPRKLKQARKDGQIARSPDLGSWAGMLAAVFLARLTVQDTIHSTTVLFNDSASVMSNPDPGNALHLLGTGLFQGVMDVAPLAGGILVVGVAVSVAQGGVHVSSKSFKPKMDHLNPFKGIKKVFGVRGAWEVSKALVKTAILAALLWSTIKRLMPTAQAGQIVPLDTVLHNMSGAVFSFARNAAIAGLLMAVADYVYQARKTRKGLKMSKQEIKDEYRNQEGDPAVKSQIRSRQMAMRRSRMIQQVAIADVVLVNPTHVAVALKYSAGQGAPRVVAKGAGAIAAKIRAEAEKHRVPMVEDIPLTRAIYKVCDLGQEIPGELFMAVARILAFVFALKSRGSAAGTHKRPATSQRELDAVLSRRRKTSARGNPRIGNRRGAARRRPAPTPARTR
jgi:flagellar biosynthesis protein FlhB